MIDLLLIVCIVIGLAFGLIEMTNSIRAVIILAVCDTFATSIELTEKDKVVSLDGQAIFQLAN